MADGPIDAGGLDEGDDAEPAVMTPVWMLLQAMASGIARFDAEVLLAHHLGLSRLAMLQDPGRLVAEDGRLTMLVARRMRHEPVAYITGHREFWSLDLKVTRDVLIPRPDSETLIAAALEAFEGRAAPSVILDLGTGSGALLLAALSEFPEAMGIGIDLSSAALAVAKDNAVRLGLGNRAAFEVGDWLPPVVHGFPLVLCNPPYVETTAALSIDVRKYEPAMALFAGADGLEAYRRLLPGLPELLAPDGVAIIEIGATQAEAVLALAARHGLVGALRRDLAGRDRCLIFRREKTL